jgi:glycosyltransferase involved in cell wall biosynthesis
MKIKVLHVIPSFIEHSGPAKAIEIYFSYNTKDYQHICVEIYKSSNVSKNIIYSSLVKKKKIFSFTYILKFLLILKRVKPSIIHAHLPQANILSRISKIFFPKIKIINTYRISENENDNFGIYSNLYRFLFKISNSIVDCHLAISKRIYEELIDDYLIDANKVSCIINASNYLQNIKNNYEVMEDGYLSFISVGTLSKRKNYNKLISLFKNNNKIKLYIYGEGEEKEFLLNEIKRYDLSENVFLMGFNPNIIDEIINYDCYITLSKSEGISRAMLESLQVGLPLISSDVSGVDECIKVGINGFILKNEKYKEFNKYINILKLVEIREKFGNNSKKIYENHTPEKHIINMNKVYDNLIKMI